MKKASLIVITSAVLIILINLIFAQSQKSEIPTVNLNTLRKEIVTDKEVYSIGEPINATLYIYNDQPHSVKFKTITHYYVEGYSPSDPNRIIGDTNVSPSSEYTTIQANSELIFEKTTFISQYEGEFIIRILGVTATVNVITP